ncbi:MAG: mercury methylation corrinoid protein HgcA [Methanoregula sp.]|nr:mercury methylation corrinoid protein HgcA [Methanoregula sp.]
MTSSQPSCCSCSSVAEVSPCSCSSGTSRHAEILKTDSTITFANRLDHFLARWGINRMGHRVEPGLYRLGNPVPESPVFASANYTMSFDAVRSALAGLDVFILVLDTKGINVWCAAGKGTFGTDELVNRIETTGLVGIVTHRKIIVPQLGAPGISANGVQRRSGFKVEYGPVRARDLPEYLMTGATSGMRRVVFPVSDRIVLAPMELVHIALPTIVIAAVLWFLAGPIAALAAISAVIAGTVLFPVLLPFIPTKDFSTKGLLLGGIVAIPFAAAFAGAPGLPGWAALAAALTPLLIMPAVTAYLTLNFTGSTTFTSRTGVRKEIFQYVPVMTFMAVFGTVLGITLGVGRLMGVL